MEIFSNLLNPVALISLVGLIGIFAIIFAESGLFFGFFLPGDSLLFAAGLLASQGYFSFPVLLIGCIAAAILGDNVGYYFGKRVGPRIFLREDSFFFNKAHVRRAAEFYEKHGKKTIILARFVPVVRTFAPILAGVGNMHYGTFLKYNIVGGLLWCLLLIPLGYFLGSAIPNIDAYILPIILFIIFVSFIPIVWNYIKEKRKVE